MSAERAAELVARTSYGRLVAILASRTRDVAAAEDALADAFVAALTQWPRDGVPVNPDAWLVTAARRRIVDAQRRVAVRERGATDVARHVEELAEREAPIMDERLGLLFACTHPAIEPAAQLPLMLQTVLGLSAEAIGSALRVAPKTMGQRLWRGKQRIRDTGIPFTVPDAGELPSRVASVLEAIYAAFGTAWDDARARNLTDEAVMLARALVELLPGEAETYGLLALLLFVDARREARRVEGRYVPLDEQDRARWDRAQIDEAEALLRHAVTLGSLGPYQLEAALQSAHVAGAAPDDILHLYDGLIGIAPSLGALVSRASALIASRGGDAALAALDAIDERDYQPWWAVRAAALRVLGRVDEARDAYERAAALSEDPAVRDYLLTQAG